MIGCRRGRNQQGQQIWWPSKTLLRNSLTAGQVLEGSIWDLSRCWQARCTQVVAPLGAPPAPPVQPPRQPPHPLSPGPATRAVCVATAAAAAAAADSSIGSCSKRIEARAIQPQSGAHEFPSDG